MQPHWSEPLTARSGEAGESRDQSALIGPAGRPGPEVLTVVAASLETVGADPVGFAEQFYSRLFAAAPGVRAFFPADLTPQHERLAAALVAAIKALTTHDPAAIEPVLAQMGAQHASRYGVRPEHYPLVGEALVQAARDVARGDWSTLTSSAWVALYEWLAGHMLRGARLAGDTKPVPAALHRAVREANPTQRIPSRTYTAQSRPSHDQRSAAGADDRTGPPSQYDYYSGRRSGPPHDGPPAGRPASSAQRRAPQHTGARGGW